MGGVPVNKRSAKQLSGLVSAVTGRKFAMRRAELACRRLGKRKVARVSSRMWKRFEDAKYMEGGFDRALEVLLAHACAVSFDEGLCVDDVLYLMFTNPPG